MQLDYFHKQKLQEEWKFQENVKWCEELEKAYSVPSYRQYKFYQGQPSQEKTK